jgi:hypothetical protein
VESSGHPPRSTPVVVAGCAAAAALAVATAAVVGVAGELSAGAHVAVLGSGALVVGVGLGRRAGAGSPPVGRRGAPWLVWAGLALVWEAVTLVSDGLPAISDLLDPVLAPAPVRAAATLAWLALGAWLVTRPGPQR